MPELLDLRDLREETVTAQVEAPAVPLDRAADAADQVVGLEHEGVLALLGEQVGGGEATGAGTRNDDGGFQLLGHVEEAG